MKTIEILSLIQVYNLKMIYLFNDSTIASNCWQTAYLQLQQKYYTLSTAYSSAIQISNQLHDKIKTLQIENKSLRENKTIERLSNQEQGESCSFQPLLRQQPENVRRGVRTTHSRIKKQSSTEWDSRGSACIYECSYPQCGKIYSSSVSLNLHIKIKHNGGTKKQREAYAKLLIEAAQRGQEAPRMDINLPPNFLEEFKTTYEYMKKYNM